MWTWGQLFKQTFKWRSWQTQLPPQDFGTLTERRAQTQISQSQILCTIPPRTFTQTLHLLHSHIRPETLFSGTSRNLKSRLQINRIQTHQNKHGQRKTKWLVTCLLIGAAFIVLVVLILVVIGVLARLMTLFLVKKLVYWVHRLKTESVDSQPG
jgi:hypothetical protein